MSENIEAKKDHYYEFDGKLYLKRYYYLFVLLWLLPPTILCVYSFYHGLFKTIYIPINYGFFLFAAVAFLFNRLNLWKKCNIQINSEEMIYTRVRRDGYNYIDVNGFQTRISYEKCVDVYRITNIQSCKKVKKGLLIEGEVNWIRYKQFNSHNEEKDKYISKILIPSFFAHDDLMKKINKVQEGKQTKRGGGISTEK